MRTPLPSLFLAVGLLAGFVSGPPTVSANTNRLNNATVDVQDEIRSALTELNALRSRIERERAPLAVTHGQLSRTVREKRQALAQLEETRRYSEQQQQALSAAVARLDEESEFVLTVLTEYRRELETRASPASIQSFRAEIEDCDRLLADADRHAGLPTIASAILSLGMNWNQARLGGYRAAGSALNAEGIEEEGVFFFAGPIGYFATRDGIGGLVQTRFGSIYPTYYPDHSAAERYAIAELVNGRAACVPVDVTDGKALKVAAAGDTFAEHVRKGGFVMIPLLAIGIVAIGLTLWKFFELRGMRLATTDSLVDVIAQLNHPDPSAAQTAAQALHAPLSALICEALAYRDAPREHLEEILHERIQAMMPKLERHLGTLAVLGGVAPLLGLLGTVTGMIHTFDLVTIFGTGEARLLSGGISEALITTKFGLGIAIPVLLVHAFMARRVRSIVTALENTAARFINVLKIGAPSP